MFILKHIQEQESEGYMAKLFFRYGAMNCGKSTNLLQVAHNYEEQGMKIIVAKPKIDTKGNDKVVSRIGAERKVDLLIDKDLNVFNTIKKKYKNISCILLFNHKSMGAQSPLFGILNRIFTFSQSSILIISSNLIIKLSL